jgi:hypothetical protein
MSQFRWTECIDHYDLEAERFLTQHFSQHQRNVLLVAGAGFDPRATTIVKKLGLLLDDRLKCIFLKEERPDPDVKLVEKADFNLAEAKKACKNLDVLAVNIIANDNAVVGGINVANLLSKVGLTEYTDVVIDMSALSIGISFPTVKLFYDTVSTQKLNLNIHLVVVSKPALDSLIQSLPNDRATEIRGFPRDRLLGAVQKAILWLPQLAGGRREILKLIQKEINPHDICPILPLSSSNPKKADNIVGDFIAELMEEWEVDPRNFVYADERNPLDIYRTILQINDQRMPVFETFGGSAVILSPLGSKLLAIGALMAALERQFPVVYVEALGYKVDWDAVETITEDTSTIAHIWLYGDAYLRDLKGQE